MLHYKAVRLNKEITNGYGKNGNILRKRKIQPILLFQLFHQIFKYWVMNIKHFTNRYH